MWPGGRRGHVAGAGGLLHGVDLVDDEGPGGVRHLHHRRRVAPRGGDEGGARLQRRLERGAIEVRDHVVGGELPRSPRRDLGDQLPDLIRTAAQAADDAKAAGIADRSHKGRRRGRAHAGLEDRDVDAEELAELPGRLGHGPIIDLDPATARTATPAPIHMSSRTLMPAIMLPPHDCNNPIGAWLDRPSRPNQVAARGQ